jgi:hypothetical protein
MYLFNRNTRVVSGGGAGMADLVAVTDYVNRNTDLDTSLYSMAIGSEPGSVSWASLVQRRSELVDANDKLLPRDEYWAIVDRIRQHTTPVTDALLSPIHATGDIGAKPDYVSSVWAQSIGSIPAAAGWAIEMANLVTEITGHPVLLSTNAIGPMGQLGFMSAGGSIDELEDRTNAIWADERYMAKLGEAKDMFQPGVGGSSIWRKVH